MIPDRKISAFLVKAGRLDQQTYEAARGHQNKFGVNLATALDAIGFLGREEILGIVSHQMGCSVVDLERFEPSREAMALISEDHCRCHKILPLAVLGRTITVAMDDPFDVNVMDTIQQLTDRKVLPVLVREGQIDSVIDRFYLQHVEPDLREMAQMVEREFEPAAPATEVVAVSADVTEESAPIIQLANKIVEDAHDRRASDIHIEPFADETLVRVRVDSVLEPVMRLPKSATRALVSRIKIMAKLNIAEKRLPQDGRISFQNYSRLGTDLELRVSTLPVAAGEKVVMRLIDRRGSLVGLDKMGFSAANLDTYRARIVEPYGMILHVGPTGSGKTTTLYGALAEIMRPEINIVTAEDPIEYTLKGLNQSQVHAEIGYTFARALRSFLRQDPDVILVGEIRDIETATIAVEASLTGHLLLSTLHTNDAVGTVTRLVEMGIEPFLVASSLLCVCAQRLMRRLCDCHQKRPPTDAEEELLAELGDDVPVNEIGAAAGCAECKHTGYAGRVGTHELMVVGPQLKRLITERVPEEELHAAAVAEGMVPLHLDALSKVAAGTTTVEEALRVVRVS